MCEWHLFSLKLTKSRKKSLPKNEAFDSQNTNDVRLFRCDDYDNYDGGLLRMRNHA